MGKIFQRDLQDYVIRKTNGKRKYVYEGELYYLNISHTDIFHLKFRMIALSVLEICLLIFNLSRRVSENNAAAVIIPAVFALLGLMISITGILTFSFSREKMMKWEYRQSDHCISIGNMITAILFSVLSVSHVVYAVIAGEADIPIVWFIEAGYIVCALISWHIYKKWKGLKFLHTKSSEQAEYQQEQFEDIMQDYRNQLKEK